MTFSFSFIKTVVVFCAVFFIQSSVQAQQKEWTVLVFLNGHNNLDPNGFDDLNEMERVGSTDQVNVVVQWASQRHQTTKRLLVRKDDDTTNVTSPILEDLPRVDMGSYQNLIEFVKWGIEHYPAKHYFVDVWNHGSGWHDEDDRKPTRNISLDDFSGNQITTAQLGLAMKEISEHIGRKVDLVGADACLMAMAEVLSEIEPYVDVFVGSQEVEDLDGWPYDDFLAGLGKDVGFDTESVARHLVEVYGASYNGGSQGYDSIHTQSAIRLSKLKGLQRAVAQVAGQIESLSYGEIVTLKESLEGVLSFTFNDYVDLGDLITSFKSAKTETQVSWEMIETALNDVVIHVRNGSSTARARGLSIWFPTSDFIYGVYLNDYKSLLFDQATGWSKALAKFY